MGLRSRNDNEKQQRRQALLDGAQSVFFSKGFEHTSMDDIASEAGFSRALLYVYFKDKKDIYRSLRIRSVEVLRDRMLAHVNLSAPGITRIRQVGEAFYQFYLEDKKHFDCLSLNISLNNQHSSLRHDANHDPESIQAEKETMQIMVDAIQAGIEDGSIDKHKVPNPLQIAMFLRGCLHGVIQLQDENGSALLDKAGLDKHALVEFTLDQVTATLAP